MISKKIQEMIVKEKPNLRHATSINAFGSNSLSVFDNVSHTLIAGVHGVDSSHFVVVDMEKIKIRQATKQGYIECDIGGVFDMRYPKSKTRCGRVKDGGHICPTLLTESQIVRICKSETKRYRIRKLTPRECLRLMGCNEKTCKKLTESNISNSQLYKMAGNSIVVDCLFHMFRQAFTTDRDEVLQPTLF